MNAVTGVSERRVCRVLEVPRSRMHPVQRERRRRGVRKNIRLVNRVGELAVEHPTFGYRRLWALLRRRDGILVNRKVVYRILRDEGWFVHQRSHTPRPRVRARRSRAERSNERWAMDLTHIPCGRDGWAHLAAVIDCHDREIVGYEFALRGRAREAERALEEACIRRFGTLRPAGDYAGRPLGQRPHLPEPPVSSCLPRLPTETGVHHAVHPGAERSHRAFLSQPEGEVHLAAQLLQLQASSARDSAVDRLVQHGTAAPGSRLHEPERVPSRKRSKSGLTFGEHYTRVHALANV